MANTEWRETTVEFPALGLWDYPIVRSVRFSGAKVQVEDSRDILLPTHEKLVDWVANINEVCGELEDAVISAAEPFEPQNVSDVSLIITGWREPNEFERKVLFPMQGTLDK